MNLKIKCSGCEQIFKADSSTVKTEELKVLTDGANISVIYYECPICSSRVVVQVDNNQTKGLLKRYKKLLFTKVKKRKKDKDLNESMQNELSELHEELKRIRYDLALKYEQHAVLDENNICSNLDVSYIKEVAQNELNKLEEL